MNTPLAYSIAEACAVARAGRTAIYEAKLSSAASLLPASEVARHLSSQTTCAGGSKPSRLSNPSHD